MFFVRQFFTKKQNPISLCQKWGINTKFMATSIKGYFLALFSMAVISENRAISIQNLSTRLPFTKHS